jgi:hypothetical protein
MRRGLPACDAEWQLIATTHNLLRLALAPPQAKRLNPRRLAALAPPMPDHQTQQKDPAQRCVTRGDSRAGWHVQAASDAALVDARDAAWRGCYRKLATVGAQPSCIGV